MVVKKQRKVVRMRGSRTHGYGRSHRGSGNKGGCGKSGGGKKADHMRRSYAPDYFGKQGFKTHNSRPVFMINCRDLDTRVEDWVAEGSAKKEGDAFVVDLGKLGYDKLIGGGRITRKIRVTVQASSECVAEKLKAAGGELVKA